MTGCSLRPLSLPFYDCGFHCLLKVYCERLKWVLNVFSTSSQYLEKCLAHYRCSITTYWTSKWINKYISNILKHLKERICRYWSSLNREWTAALPARIEMGAIVTLSPRPRQRMTRESTGIWENLTWFHSDRRQKVWLLFRITWIFVLLFFLLECSFLFYKQTFCFHLFSQVPQPPLNLPHSSQVFISGRKA